MLTEEKVRVAVGTSASSWATTSGAPSAVVPADVVDVVVGVDDGDHLAAAERRHVGGQLAAGLHGLAAVDDHEAALPPSTVTFTS